jgi:hypothetical protein
MIGEVSVGAEKYLIPRWCTHNLDLFFSFINLQYSNLVSWLIKMIATEFCPFKKFVAEKTVSFLRSVQLNSARLLIIIYHILAIINQTKMSYMM